MASKNNPISRLIRVGITAGDPSGIGPAIILKALSRLGSAAHFTVIGDRWVFSRLKAIARFPSGARFVDLNNVPRRNFAFGKVRPEYGKASIEYLDKALELLKEKEIDCLVTAPISKEAIAKAGFNYSGHTEYLIKKTGAKEAVMLLLNDKLKFSLVTRHIPINKVTALLTEDRIRNNIFITYESLRSYFGIRKPRIAVCGANPHASDNGVIGKEENRVIKPALKTLNRRLKAAIVGPLSSDVATYLAFQGKYDCLIAMYHDQALIPLKLTGADSGVNMTLGLGFIRTSPLHGTAFDIANKARLAKPDSLIAAIKLAIECASNLKKA